MTAYLAPYFSPFLVAAIDNPKGYRPGLYYFVVHRDTGNKVTKYLTSAAQAYRKAVKYERWLANGDRHWPAVTRWDELETNHAAVPTFWEAIVLHFGLYPAWD